MDYPLWIPDIGPGILIGIVAIAHVLVSHFAVGGGIVMAVVETLAVKRGDAALRQLAKRTSLILILVSTVFGAITGVGIWVTIGLLHPVATSALIHSYVWGWATEWVFFILEVATALAYYATWEKVRPRTHLLLIWLYAFAAFMSLVIIQGIISFMLTPGNWLETKEFVDGFFNPTYLPGLVLRTGICIFLAGAYMVFAALREQDSNARARLVRLLAALQVVGVLVTYGGYRWWEAALPEAIRALFLGANPKLAALASTRHFLLWMLTAYLVFVIFAWALPRAQRWPIAAVSLALAFAFFGGYERLREGARKPFIIRDYMFSNGILVSEIAQLNEQGILSKAKWLMVGQADDPLSKGRAVFRAQCAMCHTENGYLSIRKLVEPTDEDMITGILATMKEEGEEYLSGKYVHKGHIATDQLDYPFMPPLVGTDEEVEALKAYLMSLKKTTVAEVRHGN
ncbi:MAG: cytochrome ubiquinol oxidase subunit I [Thermoanaerobaculum sp.]|nr:cytochrome ubiquinol oxidase subunit I [Thermoanaerobaculum sp.]